MTRLTVRRAELHHSAGQPRQLQLVARADDAQRRHQIGRGAADHRAGRIEHVRRELHPTGAADIDYLLHCVIDQRRNIGIIAQIADGPPYECAQAADRHQPDELLPTWSLNDEIVESTVTPQSSANFFEGGPLALVDCNNFYVSQPELRGRPVVVLSNNDGGVIARSNEARALGIEMGAVAPAPRSPQSRRRHRAVEQFTRSMAI
jgi:impB/mucB/samB family